MPIKNAALNAFIHPYLLRRSIDLVLVGLEVAAETAGTGSLLDDSGLAFRAGTGATHADPLALVMNFEGQTTIHAANRAVGYAVRRSVFR